MDRMEDVKLCLLSGVSVDGRSAIETKHEKPRSTAEKQTHSLAHIVQFHSIRLAN